MTTLDTDKLKSKLTNGISGFGNQMGSEIFEKRLRLGVLILRLSVEKNKFVVSFSAFLSCDKVHPRYSLAV